MAKSELLSLISTFVFKNPKSKIEAEAYLNGTSQGELVLPVPSAVAGSLLKEHPRTHGFLLVELTARREGRPYSWSA